MKQTMVANLLLLLLFGWSIQSVQSIVTSGNPDNAKWIINPEEAPFFVSLFERGSCAGTIVGINHVVTAAHCLCELSEAPSTILWNGNVKKPVAAYTNPECEFSCENDGPNKCDASILVYDEALSADNVPLEVYRWDDEVGKTIVIYGYGLTGNAEDFTRSCSGAKKDAKFRKAENIVTSTTNVLRYKMDRAGKELEGMSQDGDSGGPAVIIRNGVSYVAGANSGTDESNPCDYGSVDQYTRLSLHYDFISKVMANPSTLSPLIEWGVESFNMADGTNNSFDFDDQFNNTNLANVINDPDDDGYDDPEPEFNQTV